MKAKRPLKPCKGAIWNTEIKRWEMAAGKTWPKSDFRRKPKRAKQEKIYLERRKWFLIQPENQICPVLLALHREQHQTSQTHHMAGREGRLLLAEEFWLAVSPVGHEWIHAHPLEARKRGWMLSKK